MVTEINVANLRKNLGNIIAALKKPIVIKVHNKAVAILSPVTEEEKLYQSMKNGEITYDQYRRKMLGVGYQNLADGKVMVRPSDIIGSEKVEIEKEKVRIEGSKFLLDAAKFWASRDQLHYCTKCGHQMLPAEAYKEFKDEQEEDAKKLKEGDFSWQ